MCLEIFTGHLKGRIIDVHFRLCLSILMAEKKQHIRALNTYQLLTIGETYHDKLMRQCQS